jgi:rhodanese-related sulfurtransferase
MHTIDADTLAQRLDAGEPIRLIDVLPPEHFQAVHLPGAESIPLEELRGRAPEQLEKGETIVVYCSGPDCGLSPRAARILEDLGFGDVHHFEGGIVEWRRSGRPLVRDASGGDAG